MKDKENNYETKIGTFKSLKHFSEKGMLIGQTDYNDDFYDIFAGETCEFDVFDKYGETFHEETKVQVNPDDIDFGCELCGDKAVFIINGNNEPDYHLFIDGDSTLVTSGYDNYELNINYCPMCGRKLKINE